MIEERRRYERTNRRIRVEMTHPSMGVLVGFTTDISEGGAQVKLEGQPSPPEGTQLDVRFHKVVGPINAEPVKMRVVHAFRGVLGLTFAV